MDPVGIIVFLLTSTIALNSAKSRDGYVPLRDAVEGTDTTLRPVFRRFEWKHLEGKPVAMSGRRRRALAFEPVGDKIGNSAPRAVYWIPTMCDPLVERGYTCVGCGESLHCMGGGFALKAICGSRRPFCFNGICSTTRGEMCKIQDKPSVQLANATTVIHSDVEPGVGESHREPELQESLKQKFTKEEIEELLDMHDLYDTFGSGRYN